MKTPMTREEFHHQVRLWCLALFVCSLPLSPFLLSISQFLLLLNWIAEGRWNQKADALKNRPEALLFLLIPLVYLAGLAYTSNYDYGVPRLKNTLTLALLPLVLVSSGQPSPKQLHRILLAFCLAVAAAAVICLAAYAIDPQPARADFRKFSLFMPHIRFALLILMSIILLLYQLMFRPAPAKQGVQLLLAALAVFLMAFLFVLRSFSGILLLVPLLAVFGIRLLLRLRNRAIRVWLLSLLLVLPLLALAALWHTDRYYFHVPPVDPSSLETLTPGGRPYSHDPADLTLENGNRVSLYLCEPELKTSWEARSTLSYEGKDHKGQEVRYTLRRYLASKGLRKDSSGMAALSDGDIRRVEAGIANYRFSDQPGFSQRLYETLWEIHMWQQTGFAMSHSFGQRLIFIRTAGEIIGRHFWFGVGTGDVYDAMMETARNNHAELDARWKGEPHNQFAFMWMAFGLTGLALILFAWITPVVRNKATKSLVFNLFALTVGISMFVLDTLESYDNVAFFAFFYTVLVFVVPRPHPPAPSPVYLTPRPPLLKARG
jgi:hypothetical protein